MKKLVAFNAASGDFEFFESDELEQAKKYLEETSLLCDMSYTKEFIEGKCWIAEITHRSFFKVDDERKNYPCMKVPERTAECSVCYDGDENCDVEEWPYGSDWDMTGIGFMRKDVEDI
jgi:hypothetical protein